MPYSIRAADVVRERLGSAIIGMKSLNPLAVPEPQHNKQRGRKRTFQDYGYMAITEKQEHEYFAKKYPVKIKKAVSNNRRSCKECRYFDLENDTYGMDCFGCKIYHPNLFERRNKNA